MSSISDWTDEEIDTHYTMGQCHHVAIALHRATGFQYAVMWNPLDWHREPDEETGEPGLIQLVHIFVVDGDDGIDIRGRRTIADLRMDIAGPDWEACPVEIISEERLSALIWESEHLSPIDEEDIDEAFDVLKKFDRFQDLINSEKSRMTL